MSQIAILTEPTQTTSWADNVADAADSNRRALGFIPKPRYRAACEVGRIFIAIRENATGHEYAGHIMFGGAGSELHIQQLFVSENFRRHGVARFLVDALVRWAESRNYLGMAIRVAADLRSSNQAWDRLGFDLIRTVKGRGAGKRLINLRHRELRSQSLLQFVQAVGKDDVAFSVPPNVGRGGADLCRGPQRVF
jgi:GNAT superfamily N-acetyltransferase